MANGKWGLDGDSAGLPLHSEYGLALKSAHGVLQRVIFKPRPFTNQTGAVGDHAPVIVPITTPRSYGGVLPLNLQPAINKPFPWE